MNKPSTPPSVRAWAWLSFEESDAKQSTIIDFGNGSEYQYPIFSSRKEAESWKKNNCGTPGLLDRLVQVTITVHR